MSEIGGWKPDKTFLNFQHLSAVVLTKADTTSNIES